MDYTKHNVNQFSNFRKTKVNYCKFENDSTS
jgi:hypothetical protein